MLKIKQSSSFAKSTKKLHENQKKDLDKAIKLISKDPSLGDGKIGDLNGVYVYKFKMNKQDTLLAYSYDSTKIFLLALGSHENFYRNLKKR